MSKIYCETDSIVKLAELINQLLCLKPGFKISDVLDKLGGKINYIKTGILKEELRIDNKDFYFTINIFKNQPYKNQRFAAAIQLGDLILHTNYLTDFCLDYKYNKLKFIKERNITENIFFANAFLMPERLIRDLLSDFLTIEEIAERLKVNYEDLYSRGIELNLWT